MTDADALRVIALMRRHCVEYAGARADVWAKCNAVLATLEPGRALALLWVSFDEQWEL